MFGMKKITEKQCEEKREKRSAFRSRLVDEFKKVAFIGLFFFFVGCIIWCFILMGRSVTVNYLLPMGFGGFLVTLYGVYAASSAVEKKSLNDNDIVKNKDGTFSKIMNTVASVIAKSSEKSDDPEAKG